MWWMIGIGLSVASSTNHQDGENGPQLRSHLDHILNVPQRVRLRCGHRLRPCWMTVLTILHNPWKLRFLLGISFLALLACTDIAQAQLERLRKDRPVEQAALAETPMVEIPAGEFAMGSDGGRRWRMNAPCTGHGSVAFQWISTRWRRRGTRSFSQPHTVLSLGNGTRSICRSMGIAQ